MSSAVRPQDVDLGAFFAAWTDRAGRLVQHEPVVACPLSSDESTASPVRLALDPGGSLELRLCPADVAVLAGGLLFLEDDEVRARSASPPDAADVAAVTALLRETLPGATEVSPPASPRQAIATWRAPFTVAGTPASEVLLVELVANEVNVNAAAPEPVPTGNAAAAAGALPASGPEEAARATESASPSPLTARVGAGQAPASTPAGRVTVLVVSAEADTGARLTAALAAAGLRVLDQHAPRAVLDWTLAERVVDAILLDAAWPHAARLRQNLAADKMTRDLPVLPLGPDSAAGEDLLAEIDAAVRAKRAADAGRA